MSAAVSFFFAGFGFALAIHDIRERDFRWHALPLSLACLVSNAISGALFL